MKNSYIAIAVIIIIVILSFVLGRNKTEAPQEVVSDNSVELGSPTLPDGSYKVDVEASVLKWGGEYITGKKEEGTVKFKSGSATVLAGVVSTANFVLDMSSIKDNASKEMLENHLKSDAFFDSTNFPESSFILRSITPSSSDGAKLGKYIVGGNLTVKGIEKPISFPATITLGSDGSIKATSSFAINRADWSIKYNSQTFFSNLGDKTIRDAVEIGLDIRAVKE